MRDRFRTSRWLVLLSLIIALAVSILVSMTTIPPRILSHTAKHWLGWAHSSHLHGWDSDIMGYVASALVLATFCMKSMRSLRLIAVMSNIAFITYAASTDMRPILILHSILLPVNIVRLAQIAYFA